MPLGYRGYAAAGGGGPSLRPLGFRAGPGARAALLDRAAVLAQDQADDDFNVLAAAAMLWDGGDHEQGYFLTRQLADRRVADAASSMYDIHRGFRDNTPDSYLDDAVRDQWLQRAVEEGSPLAMYNMAYRNIFEDELDFSRREPGQVLRLLHGARQEPRADALARLRIGVLLRDHGTEQEQRKACAPICVRWWTRITTGARAPAPRSRWPTRTGAAPGRIASPPSNGRSTPAGCSLTTKASTRSSRRC